MPASPKVRFLSLFAAVAASGLLASCEQTRERSVEERVERMLGGTSQKILADPVASTGSTPQSYPKDLTDTQLPASAKSLSPATRNPAAADLLFTLTSLAVWAELVPGLGWDAARYRSHVVYLATSALTK